MLDLLLPDDELRKAVEALVQEKVQESRVLDYKESHYAPPDICGSNKEIAKDISAFANAGGGQLIIGVEDDGRGIPVCAEGAKRTGRDEALRIENVATSGIQPKLAGLDVKTVSLSADREFVIVRIPQSISAPHMVVADGDYRYYTRRNLKSEPMEESEVRLLYETRYRALQRVDEFLDSLQWPRRWHDPEGPRLELVACPLFISEDRVDPTDRAWKDRVQRWLADPSRHLTSGFSAEEVRIFKDGFVVERRSSHEDPREQVVSRQIEIFRSGCVRACLPAPTNNEGRLFGPVIAKYLREFTALAARVLNEVAYLGEVRLRLRLHNALGLSFFHIYLGPRESLVPGFDAFPTWEETEPISEITNAFGLMDKPDAPARRLADRVWNCLGLRRCDLWDETTGEWKGP